MGQIRKQAILSSIVIYVGFAIGLVNVFFFVKNGTFTTEQYGLTRLMNDMSFTFFSFASMGVVSYIYRFYPYYHNNLSKQQNDQLGFSLVVVLVGFVLVLAAGILFQPLIVRKFTERSPLFVHYYYWLFPFTLGILLFTLFEAFAWFLQLNVFTNFLKEAGLRLLQTCFILLFLFGWVSYDGFIKLFSFSFLIIAAVLIFYVIRKKLIHVTFRWSKVTKKYWKQIAYLMLLIYGGHIINTLAQYIDGIIIASVSVQGLKDVGVYTLSNFIATTIQVPQRSIVSATIPALSFAWKRKDLTEIGRIYSRSSINLLLLSLFLFGLIWFNLDDLFTLFDIKKDFEAGKMVVFFIGISKVIDAGTGVNSQLIGTSRYWKFEVVSGMILLFVFIPLNYLLVKTMGINGSAISNLVSFSLYNGIRIWFIWKKFGLQPFSIQTVKLLAGTLACYAIIYLLFDAWHGWAAVIIRSIAFSALMITVVIAFRITPDLHQLLLIGRNKLKRRSM